MNHRLLLVGLLPLAAVAQAPVSVVARLDGPRVVISRDLYGQFAEHLGRCVYGGFWVEPGLNVPRQGRLRLDVVEALRKLHVPNMRWPGGCYADAYHWRDGVGPPAQRPARLNMWWGDGVEDNSFGTHEFLELCELLGCTPYLAANVGSGTVEEMAGWLEYLNAGADTPLTRQRAQNGHPRPYGVSLWGIGNESWGCGGTMTAEYYTDVYRRYATFAHHYPGAPPLRKVASGANGDDPHWTETCMKNIPAGQLWGLSLHQYTLPTGSWAGSKGPSVGFGEAEYFSTLRNCLKMDEVLTRHAALMDRYDPQKQVALLVDEWGVWTDPLPGGSLLYQQNTLRDALVAAVTLNIFHQHCDRVRGANLAQAVNVLQALILTDKERMLLTPTYHVFDLYQVHQDAEYVPLQFTSPAYALGGQTIPALSASASRDKSGALHLSLVNLDPHHALPLEAALPGSRWQTVTGRILTAAGVADYNSFDQPGTVAPAAFTGARRRGDQLAVTLPPHSVVILELR